MDRCSHEIKRHLLLGRKALTNPDSILKSRDIPLLTKVCAVNATVFLVVRYVCESWIKKKFECQRTDAFKLWCYRRLLRIPWTARSNQWILKEISPEYSLEDWCWSWSSNTLVAWCKEPTHWKRPWCWERLKAGREGGDRGWDGWMASPTQWTWIWADSRRQSRTVKPGMLQSVGSQTVGDNLTTEQHGRTAWGPLGGRDALCLDCSSVWGEILLPSEGCYCTSIKGTGCLGLRIFSYNCMWLYNDLKKV